MPFNIPSDPDIAEQARTTIFPDLRCYDSVPVLAKKIGTNPYTLHKAFRDNVEL